MPARRSRRRWTSTARRRAGIAPISNPSRTIRIPSARNYLLSETLYESQDYQGAATEFTKTAYDYPRNPRSAAAAYAALGSFTKYEASLPPAEKTEAHKLAVDAGVKFGTSFPEHPDSAGVLTRAAEDIFATQDLQRSIEVANLVLAHQPPADQPKRRIAYTIIGQANFDLLQFAEAEKGYIAARDLLPPNDKMRADLTERIASAVYRQGEAKQKSGDNLGAVDDFLRISQVAGTSKIAAQAEYDAGAQLIILKEWPRAIQVLEHFRANNPKSEFSADVTRKLAVAFGETGQAGQAAVEFERIAMNPAESKDIQREANLQAADLYAKAGNTPKAVGMLERFVVTYPTPVADSIEARRKLAEIAGTAGNIDKQRSWQREIVNADRTAGAGRTDRTQYLAAKSQLALASPARDEFRSIALVLPLKTSLAKKRKAMEAALGGYKAAADYRVAEVTTVATYEIAEIYRKLGQDIMKSERPKKLDADQLDEYSSLLEEQAFPFEEQAISTHEINTKRARETVYDDGVKKSYTALAELNPGRYAKTRNHERFVRCAGSAAAAGAGDRPPIATPQILADRRSIRPAKPGEARERRDVGAGCARAHHSEAAGARRRRVRAGAHPDARQRSHAGHSRDAGADAVIPGPAGPVRQPGRPASQCQSAARVGSCVGKGHRACGLGCPDLDRIRPHAAPGGQIRRGAHRLRNGYQGESILRACSPQSGCAARPVPR